MEVYDRHFLLGYLLSLFEYILEDSGSAENKEKLLFLHDKLSLASILRPLHQASQTTTTTTSPTLQSHSSTAQGPHPTKTRQQQGHTHSR